MSNDVLARLGADGLAIISARAWSNGTAVFCAVMTLAAGFCWTLAAGFCAVNAVIRARLAGGGDDEAAAVVKDAETSNSTFLAGDRARLDCIRLMIRLVLLFGLSLSCSVELRNRY
jgi:hypothetical protein